MATAPSRSFTAQQVSHAIISAGMKVHTELGPGLLESTYTACLQFELGRTGSIPPRRSVSLSFIVV